MFKLFFFCAKQAEYQNKKKSASKKKETISKAAYSATSAKMTSHTEALFVFSFLFPEKNSITTACHETLLVNSL
ncbi:hypothetical protein A3Q35_11160 [Aeribacillus pallidus]|jgi:hypothetical protein|uniref:Uncharacterized protein n=1 Tax=Aeribacillus pallidus TaxID=33936 RepID=A0A165Y2L5_9BACI|nr:hypothetical protein AP3564_14690 [Aeribacillus pallidus]KZM55623.1 hypothetical protein A3Q35_11160 [Aeribacillus pallidus]KZN96661.1 hypothetical protein AZI98_07590 [Aeribacillus pallidus]